MAISTSSAGQADSDPLLDINTTPLIDVMLVLLVMLIITIPLQLNAVNLHLPGPAKSLVPAPAESVDIAIDADGIVSVDGQPLPHRAALNRYLAALATRVEQAEIRVHPDPASHYRGFAEVLVALSQHRLHKIGIVDASLPAPRAGTP